MSKEKKSNTKETNAKPKNKALELCKKKNIALRKELRDAKRVIKKLEREVAKFQKAKTVRKKSSKAKSKKK